MMDGTEREYDEYVEVDMLLDNTKYNVRFECINMVDNSDVPILLGYNFLKTNKINIFHYSKKKKY